jgi:hypothetical protein
MSAPKTCKECRFSSPNKEYSWMGRCRIKGILATNNSVPIDWACPAFDSGEYDRAVDALIVDARVLATAALAFDDLEGKEIAAITMHDIEAVEEARKAAR